MVQFLRLAIDGYFIFDETLETLVSILERQFLISGSMAFLVYWGIVVLSAMQRYYNDLAIITERANKLETQLSSATLSTLKAQFKPHFLFNTLNMIDFLIHTDHKKAIDTLDKLEGLIKSTFDQNQPDSCTIEAEIQFLEKYLEIEQSRFRERLSVILQIDERTKNFRIPCYLIQPLVENSIKHGVGQSIKNCTIKITSKLIGEFFSIEVSDNGSSSGVHKKKEEGVKRGVGLQNITDRLKIYYGDDTLLDIGYVKNGGFKSTILIPKKYFKV